ncbi:LytR/AlgR family response regulator transcription factor [Hyphobacterium sp.]|uniref:LytR/AlgR family response regulator transcription factor n=1 Tax=Hyphobacterium sp. TaxID=2004662 RepID=UPI0037495A6C
MHAQENRPVILMCAPDEIGDGLQSHIADRCELVRVTRERAHGQFDKLVDDSGAGGIILGAHQVDREVREFAASADRTETPYLLAVESTHQAHLMFELSARDYVLLTMPDGYVAACLDRFLDSLQRQTSGAGAQPQDNSPSAPPAIWVRTGHAERKILHSAIRSISADRDYAVIETDNTSLLVRSTMTALEAELESDAFLRIHRSHIVPVNDIREVRTLGPNRHEVTLRNGRSFLVGRTYWPRIRALLRGQSRKVTSRLQHG